MADDEEQRTGHNYDGIEEYDNPLPTWWLWTFFIAMIFSFLYWIHYEFSGGQTINQELAQDMAMIEKSQKSAPIVQDREEDLEKLLLMADVKTKGHEVYQAKCAACHGVELQGGIGPNLTDEYWLHGEGKLTDIAGVIRKGVLDKGMPNWEGQIKDDEIKAVTVFIRSKLGSKPSNPKPAQGNKVVQN